MQNLTGMMATLSKKMDQMDQDRVRDRQASDATHTKLLEHLEQRLEDNMVEVKRYVSARETNRIMKRRGKEADRPTPTEQSHDSDSDTVFSSVAEEERKTGKGRSLRRRRALSDGEDRTMNEEASSTPH